MPIYTIADKEIATIPMDLELCYHLDHIENLFKEVKIVLDWLGWQILLNNKKAVALED